MRDWTWWLKVLWTSRNCSRLDLRQRKSPIEILISSIKKINVTSTLRFSTLIRNGFVSISFQRSRKNNLTVNLSLYKMSSKFYKTIQNNLLLIGILSGVFVGFAVGLALRSVQLSDTAEVLVFYPGEIVMRAMECCVLPLIITSFITGTFSVKIETPSANWIEK